MLRPISRIQKNCITLKKNWAMIAVDAYRGLTYEPTPAVNFFFGII